MVDMQVMVFWKVETLSDPGVVVAIRGASIGVGSKLKVRIRGFTVFKISHAPIAKMRP